jgi:hypothetical protein
VVDADTTTTVELGGRESVSSLDDLDLGEPGTELRPVAFCRVGVRSRELR